MNLEGTSGGASSTFSLWKKPAEVRDEKIEKLSQLIPNLVRQAEVREPLQKKKMIMLCVKVCISSYHMFLGSKVYISSIGKSRQDAMCQ